MKLRTLGYFLKEALMSLRHNSFMSLASVSTVALSLLILGTFLIMVLNLNHMTNMLESQVQINVYLQDDLSEAHIKEIGLQISQVVGVREITFVSKDEAMERFRQRLGDQQGLLAALDTNPLPNAFEVKMDRPEQVRPAADVFARIKGVENVRYGKEFVENLFAFTRMIRTVGVVLIVFLGVAAMLIISNTIRITVFARRKEIGIMKYVGATDWFIRWPFLLEGMILGCAGALMAVGILSKLYGLLTGYVHETLTFFPILPRQPFLRHLSWFLLGVGTFIGAMGSIISLRKFLKV